jgi:flagellar biosynthesis/type III secretory pathway M-ring protein FliF/YscJ
MDRLNGVLDQIKRALRELSGTQKLLIASLVVILAMTMFLVVRYTAQPAMVAMLPGASSADQSEAARYLREQGVPFKRNQANEVLVSPDLSDALIAGMFESGYTPSDTTLYFNNLIDRQSWTMSSTQIDQMHTIALQNQLARSIGTFKGVSRADVVIDAPEPRSLGMAVRQPTASINIIMEGNRSLTQQMADGAAAMVASAKAGLRLENIRVIDGNSGRQFRPRTEEDGFAGNYLEYVIKNEEKIYDKLAGSLSYIPGVIIAVNAQIDARRSIVETSTVLDPGKGTVTAPLRETTQERTQQSASRGAEPGVRPNTGLNINNAGASGNTLTDVSTTSEFETQFGRRVERITDPRGTPLKIAATINIPRSFFVAQWRAANGSSDNPADDVLAPVIAQEISRIREGVIPLIDSESAGGAPGSVVVSVIPDINQLREAMPEAFAAGAGGAAATGSGGIGGILAAAGGVRTVVLTALALAALALMAVTVRRATKADKLPTAEELVGLPPALSGETDLVGEAGEADAALSGIELTDDAIQSQKVLEQVVDMVKQRPAESASLLNRWIQSDQ